MGTVGVSVGFDGSRSSDPQGETLSYAWNFGDNTTGIGVNPTHIYTIPGTYTVSLTVTNTSNLTATAASNATIGALPPAANAGGPYTGTTGTLVSFSGLGSSDPQGEALSYAWNFGDNTTGIGINPTHIYTIPGTYTVSLTVSNTSNLSNTAMSKSTISVPALPDVPLTGLVYGGQAPIVGAHVYLFAANTAGYGGSGLPASGSNASISLLSAAETGTSDALGAYVLTGTGGSFSLTGDYICSSGQQLYLYALGGDAGSGNNPASGLLAALGSCPNYGANAITVTMNEVTTIAAAYALSGFATDATHISSSGTAMAQTDVANAFANAGNLVNLSSGVALATTPAGNGTVPQAEINTLANILDTCQNSASSCSTLLTVATADGTITGTKPTDTATAAINIAHHPGSNVAALYGLSTTVFTPKLVTKPGDLAVALKFIGGGIGNLLDIAIDGSGNVWVTNYGNTNSVTKMSSTGIILSGANGFSGGGLNDPIGIAIDSFGNAWIINLGNNSVTKISSTGIFLSGANGYTGGGLNTPESIAIDGSDNAWITDFNGGGTVTKISSSGTFLSGGNGYSGGGLSGPTGIAIDENGNAWIPNDNFSATVLAGSGSILSGTNGYIYAIGHGYSLPNKIAIDSSGNAWIDCGLNRLVEISSTGSLLSGTYSYTQPVYSPIGVAIDGSGHVWSAGNYSSGLVESSDSGNILFETAVVPPKGMAIDGSGDVWIASTEYVVEFIGIGTPVVTPLAVGVKNRMLGMRP